MATPYQNPTLQPCLVLTFVVIITATLFNPKRVLRRVLRRSSEKGVSRRCLERPLGGYAPLGVRPMDSLLASSLLKPPFLFVPNLLLERD